MKITFAFPALVAMAATAVFAAPAPANSGISIRADPPCRPSTLTRWTFYPGGIAYPEKGQLISWEIYVKDRYRDSIPYQEFTAGPDKYITRKSSDKVWSVKHQEALWGVTLKINGKEHKWNKASRGNYDSAAKLATTEYFTCIPWK
ncbi:hypothetical protein BG015_011935 [Linnemannia schmuckeri]|uniref:Uncharacterized protein n=1 Tax=Linnemannia schmuckeri TaxID=64567 RepID=A0A9P5RVD1_9FUNG|nr:hypothetical protein BG015_011935 [Linnemannia schmuckeri]